MLITMKIKEKLPPKKEKGNNVTLYINQQTINRNLHEKLQKVDRDSMEKIRGIHQEWCAFIRKRREENK